MSSDEGGIDAATAILVRGCLGGIGLAVVFLLISGTTYLALSALSAPRNLLILFTIASGPVIGSVAVLLVLLRRLKPKLGSRSATERN
jgi:hypothetical protein